MAILLALLSALFRSTGSTFRKEATGAASEVQLVFWLRLFMSSILFILILILQIDLDLEKKDVFLLLTLGVIETLATIFSFTALKRSELTSIAPFEGLVPLLLIPSGVVFLNQSFSNIAVLAIGIIVTGLLVHSSAAETIKNMKLGFLRPILMYSILTTTTILIEISLIDSISIFWLLFISSAIQSVLLITVYRAKVFSIGKKPRLQISKASVLTVGSRLLELAALGLASGAIVVAIRRSDTIITMFMSKFRLKEKLSAQQIMGAVLVFIGVFLLALQNS